MLKNKNSRKLTRFGRHSIGLLLPQDLLRSLDWREKERVLVKRVPRGLLITNNQTKRRKK
jgi:hypothetical protein